MMDNPLETKEMRTEIEEMRRNSVSPAFDFDKWLGRILFGDKAKYYGKITPKDL